MKRYTLPPERTFALSGADVGKRKSARTACASSVGKFAWLRMDVCASTRGPGLKVAQVVSSESVVEICREFAAQYMNLQEFFGVLCLDAAQQPTGFAVVAVGGIDSAAVDTRLVFKPVLLSQSVAMIVTHNHPSGNPNPSQEDILLTKRLQEGARLLGVRLLDHVIVTESKSYSFLDHGLM